MYVLLFHDSRLTDLRSFVSGKFIHRRSFLDNWGGAGLQACGKLLLRIGFSR
jgi:hypothetical protein